MKSGWKTAYKDGPHYFENGRTLCGFVGVKKEFYPEEEPNQEDACSKCWDRVHRLAEGSTEEAPWHSQAMAEDTALPSVVA
jgi:hypothetical protein